MSSTASIGGLSFSGEQLRLARENRDSQVIQSALQLFDTPRQESLDTAYLAALRYVLEEGKDESAGLAWQLLGQTDLGAESAQSHQGCQALLGWLSALAMLRDHRTWETARAAYEASFEAARSNLESAAKPLDGIWRGALQLALGIVFDREADRRAGVAAYRRAVDQHIHPEGYLKGIVDIDGAQQTYESQVSGTGALVLMAEMGEQAGLDLWAYENRAVSVHTAAAYALFYYFYPEKWRWESGMTAERTSAVIRREGAFLEMVNRRQPMRGIEALLDEQRPMFCAYGGGSTTLTHGLAPPNKPRWRFW